MMGSSTVRGRSSAFSAVDVRTNTSNTSCGARPDQLATSLHARSHKRTGDAHTTTRSWEDFVAMHMPSGPDHWMLAAKVLGCIADATRWAVRCSRSTLTSVRTMVTT